jgi:hypothetical protein
MAASISLILQQIAAAGKSYEGDTIGSRESLIELGRDLVAALEIPSEFLQRSFWAEVSYKREQLAVHSTAADDKIASLISSLQVCRSGQVVPALARCRRIGPWRR